MRRAGRALACVALSQCGGSAQHAAAPAPLPLHEPPFALVVGDRLCLIQRGELRCRDELEGPGALTRAPVLSGLERVQVTTASFGVDFGCVTTRAGTVECFGGNQYGQLGANLREERHAAPVELPSLRDARRVVSGAIHTCAILASGAVSCWGVNWFGEAGGDTTYVESARELIEPHVVEGIGDVAEIALSGEATCAVRRDGKAFCWGKEKPDDLRGGRVVPTRVPALDGVSSLTAAPKEFCGVQDGRVVCWGRVDFLMPGDRRPEDAVVPVGIDHARRVSLGNAHGCAVDTAGSVYCFGRNDHGSVGVPVRYAPEPLLPTRVPNLPPVIDLVARRDATCAITVSDEVYCWGGWGPELERKVHLPEKITL